MDNLVNEQPKEKTESIDLSNSYFPDSLRAGVYSNVANVQVTDNEVTILFFQHDSIGTTVVSKVILPISHAQSLVDVISRILGDSKKRKEQNSK